MLGIDKSNETFKLCSQLYTLRDTDHLIFVESTRIITLTLSDSYSNGVFLGTASTSFTGLSQYTLIM